MDINQCTYNHLNFGKEDMEDKTASLTNVAAQTGKLHVEE